MTRGGEQRIPRPPSVQAGGAAPWAHVPWGQRRIDLARVRLALEGVRPPPRPTLSAGYRAAAVLVPCFEEAGEARIILTKRPEEMPSHRGEIAFPGGKLHPGSDDSLAAAALREAEEEIGLRPADVEILGELATLATAVSRFSITPYVGVIARRPALVANPAEVTAVLDVPVSELLDDAVFREERWHFDDADRPMYFYELEGETVWGATARILTDFLTLLVGDQ